MASHQYYKEYKQAKCEFRRHKRKAERQWNKETYFQMSELAIGEFYKTVKQQWKTSAENSDTVYKTITVTTTESVT